MTSRCRITMDGTTFEARRGELLLDAAIKNGIALPYDCRAGHCGTCCVRVVSGRVEGGAGAEPDVVHACQCRISGDVAIQLGDATAVRSIEGILTELRPLSGEVIEVGITTGRTLPYLPGQYIQVAFAGYPNRPFSITHALRGHSKPRTMYFHMRRMAGGRVTPALGRHIKVGHRVMLNGPFGSAHFRPGHKGRLVLFATNTGFAPIWSIAVAALRENPERRMMVIAGGRSLDALYMGPALAQLARFPNVLAVPVCSGTQHLPPVVRPGRPTDYLPVLMPSDVLYACGAKGMVEAVKSVAADYGATCYADPFMTSSPVETVPASLVTRAMTWFSAPPQRAGLVRGGPRREPHISVSPFVEPRVKQSLGS